MSPRVWRQPSERSREATPPTLSGLLPTCSAAVISGSGASRVLPAAMNSTASRWRSSGPWSSLVRPVRTTSALSGRAVARMWRTITTTTTTTVPSEDKWKWWLRQLRPRPRPLTLGLSVLQRLRYHQTLRRAAHLRLESFLLTSRPFHNRKCLKQKPG